jgi:hypothetical protein
VLSSMTLEADSTSTTTSSSCVSTWRQCGGKHFHGATTCCSSFDVCHKRNNYYSQCVPKSHVSSPSSTTKPVTTKAPTTAIPKATDAPTVAPWIPYDPRVGGLCPKEQPCYEEGKGAASCEIPDSSRPIGDGRFFCRLAIQDACHHPELCFAQRDTACPCAGSIPCKEVYFNPMDYSARCVAKNKTSLQCPDSTGGPWWRYTYTDCQND